MRWSAGADAPPVGVQRTVGLDQPDQRPDDDHPAEDHQKAAKEAVALAKVRLSSGQYDIIILDEINYAVKLNLVSIQDVLDIVKVRPKKTSLVLTGNYAPEEIINVADLVTEMKEIKHPYRAGIKAKKGIDY